MPHHRQIINERRDYYQIDEFEVEETLRKVNNLLKTTKLKKTEEDFKVLKILFGVSFVSFLCAVFLGAFIHFAFAIVFTIIFLSLIVFIFLRASKREKNHLLI